MRVDMLTREYPPHVYGGAGVHVAELARVLRAHADVRVHAFDGPRERGTPGGEDGVRGYPDLAELAGANPALRTFGVDLAMADAVGGSDIVHSHTWYANLAGHLGGLLHDVPHVLSAHSLEPLRPWKAEQLGGGYALSSWAERTAYEGAAGVVAVSGDEISVADVKRVQEVARAVVERLNRGGHPATLDDLRNAPIHWRRPLCTAAPNGSFAACNIDCPFPDRCPAD